MEIQSIQLQFLPIDNHRLRELCGPGNEHILLIEKRFDVKIHHRSNNFQITGNLAESNTAKKILEQLYHETDLEQPLTSTTVNQLLQQPSINHQHEKKTMSDKTIIHTRYKTINPRTAHQTAYVHNIHTHDINFAIGPAGTGKTYLAVACAVEALEKGSVQRLIFVRPAVEAGEKLGFLPGDLEEKILPYLRPLYDALYEMLGFEHAQKLIERDVIEIAPLAFMRGRTLNEAFIILDEAQNATVPQMKMFLTRLGLGSKAVITGDITQVDLAPSIPSGLSHAKSIMADIDNISFSLFDSKDVVRHPLVAAVIQAYEQYEKNDKFFDRKG